MAIVKAIKSGASIKRIIDYVTRKDGLQNFMMDGIDCNPHTASFEMLYTRDKFSKHDGVQYVHLVYSLSPVESEKLDVEQVLLNAKLLVERTDNFKGHQTIICVHDDKKHKHAHIVINAVNFQTGKKVRWYRTDLRWFKDRLIELSREQGLEVPVKGQGNSLGGNNSKLCKSVERAFNRNYESWMLDMYEKILQIKNVSVSKDDFVLKLYEEGIKTTWDNRKTILFEDQEGHKVRNSRLEEIFKTGLDKETLENEFRTTTQLLGSEQEYEAMYFGEPKVAGRKQDFEYEAYEIYIEDARNEIGAARAIEYDSKTKRNNKIAQRKNRDACRLRLNVSKGVVTKRRGSKENARDRDDPLTF